MDPAQKRGNPIGPEACKSPSDPNPACRRGTRLREEARSRSRRGPNQGGSQCFPLSPAPQFSCRRSGPRHFARAQCRPEAPTPQLPARMPCFFGFPVPRTPETRPRLRMSPTPEPCRFSPALAGFNLLHAVAPVQYYERFEKYESEDPQATPVPDTALPNQRRHTQHLHPLPAPAPMGPPRPLPRASPRPDPPPCHRPTAPPGANPSSRGRHRPRR